jgi:hypothetical protein
VLGWLVELSLPSGDVDDWNQETAEDVTKTTLAMGKGGF